MSSTPKIGVDLALVALTAIVNTPEMRIRRSGLEPTLLCFFVPIPPISELLKKVFLAMPEF